MPAEPIKVTISDPDTGEVLSERVIENDYAVICAGNAYLDHTQVHANGTHVVTLKGMRGALAKEDEHA